MNVVILEGQAERNSEFRLTKAGGSMATLRFRTEGGKGAFDFHNVVAFGTEADTLGEIVEGQSLRVEGRLRTRSYVSNDVKRYSTEVVASSIKVIATASS